MSENDGLTHEEFLAGLEEIQRRRKLGHVLQPPRGDSGPLTSYRSDRQRLSDTIGAHASRWMEQQGYAGRKEFRGDAEDVRDSLRDAFLLRSGFTPRHAVHPMSQWSSSLPLMAIAEQLHCRSLNSTDFGSALAFGFSSLVSLSYDQFDDHNPLFKDVVVPNFQPNTFPTVDIEDLEKAPEQVGMGLPFRILDTDAGETGRLYPYQGKILISRTLILNDSFALISNAVQIMGAHCARLAPQLLAHRLNANAHLADGTALITTANTNSTAGISVAAFNEAAGKLRSMATPAGNKLNARAASWLVPADKEYTALAEVAKLGLNSPVRVIANPWLTGDKSYVFADPMQAPVANRLVLSLPLKPDVIQFNAPQDYDGTVIAVEFVTGITLVSRLGVIGVPIS